MGIENLAHPLNLHIGKCTLSLEYLGERNIHSFGRSILHVVKYDRTFPIFQFSDHDGRHDKRGKCLYLELLLLEIRNFTRQNLSLNVFLTVCASFCINFRGHRANNHVIFIMLYEKKSSTANMLPKHYPLDHTKITRCSVVYSKNRLSFVFVYANEVRQTSVHILWLTRDTNFEASSGCSRYCQCNKRFWGFDFWALSVL